MSPSCIKLPITLSAVVFLGVAVGGFSWWLMNADDDGPTQKAGNNPAPSSPRQAFTKSNIARETFEPAEHVPSTPQPSKSPPAAPLASPAPMSFIPGYPTPGNIPGSEKDLQRRVEQVEEEANFDLQQLVSLLDLDGNQQDRIFDSLVRHAPGWHPSMRALGVADPINGQLQLPETLTSSPVEEGRSPDTAPFNRADVLDAIAAELTPDQQVELASAELDRREWWEEIIPKLLPDSATPSITDYTSTAVGASPPSTDDKSAEDPGPLAE